MPPLNDRALATMRRQYGVISRPQAIRLGNSPACVDGHVKRGNLEPCLCGVYRMPGAPIPPPQPGMAGVLRCRPEAWASGPLVFGLLGVDGFSAEDLFLIVVRQDRYVQNVPFEVRRRELSSADRSVVGPIPIVVPLLALVDTATMLEEQRVLAAFDALRWKGLADIGRLLRVCDRHHRHPGARMLRRLAHAGAFEQESPGERSLDAILHPWLPHLEWQAWIAPDIRVDALDRAASLVLEYLGRRHHDGVIQRKPDRVRDQRIREHGYDVLYVTAADLDRPEVLVARVLRARDRALARLGQPNPPQQPAA